eukprot:62278-Chlamydomonas_euryale.AAC.1
MQQWPPVVCNHAAVGPTCVQPCSRASTAVVGNTREPASGAGAGTPASTADPSRRAGCTGRPGSLSPAAAAAGL